MDVSDIKKYAKNAVIKILKTCKKQGDNFHKTKEISEKFLKTKTLSKEDEGFLKLQLVDTIKIIVIIIPFVLIPGASIILPILIKVAKTKNIDLLPSTMNDESK